MSSGDEFARELFEDAKHSLFLAKTQGDSVIQQRHLRHSLFTAFSFLELQIELISAHFKNSNFFSIHERGIIGQREVKLERGVFRLKDAVRFTRLSDRMLLLQNKFKGNKLAERAWWGPLMRATERRNLVAHPRGPLILDLDETEKDILATLQCANDLFEIVFGKGLPYAGLGSKPKLPT